MKPRFALHLSLPRPATFAGMSPSSPTRWSVAVALSLAACLVQAQHSGHDHATAPAAPTAATSTTSLPWVSAEVRKVDVANGKVTLKHADVPNLDMPGMTMSFAVADRQWLQGLKPGDAVSVTLDKVQGQYTVMSLQRR